MKITRTLEVTKLTVYIDHGEDIEKMSTVYPGVWDKLTRTKQEEELKKFDPHAIKATAICTYKVYCTMELAKFFADAEKEIVVDDDKNKEEE